MGTELKTCSEEIVDKVQSPTRNLRLKFGFVQDITLFGLDLHLKETLP